MQQDRTAHVTHHRTLRRWLASAIAVTAALAVALGGGSWSFGAAAAQAATSDSYVKIDGVQGESSTKPHTGQAG